MRAAVDVRVQRAVAEANKLLEAITHPSAVERLPFGMRWIAKVILQLTRAPTDECMMYYLHHYE